MTKRIIQALADRINRDEESALVTITGAEGSSPRGMGSMMIVDGDGSLIAGTIGGGPVEEKAKRDAALCIKRGTCKTVSYNLDKNTGGLAMTCGGDVSVFIQVFKSKEKLLIVGAGHIALQLYSFAKLLDYYVAIIDNRQELLNEARFPQADRLIVKDIIMELKQYCIDEKTSVVIVTHGHEYDEAALEAVIASPARYIGMIGSRKKIEICYQNLEQRGVDRVKLAAVHAPIGLDLGGERPEEIALAIMAQIQAVKYGREGGFLSGHKS